MKRKRLRTVLVVSALAAGTLFGPSAQGTTADTKHYPDLRTLKPSDLSITRQCTLILLGSCTRLLRFSNTVWNGGNGRLELRPQNNSVLGKTTAYQRIWSHDAAGKWYLVEEVPVGEFVFHASHNHWHFEGFANYSLVNENADGSIGNNVRRSSQKTTFCVIDTDKVNANLEHSGSQTYTSCGQNDITGLTVGWGDKYAYNLSGQSIDITNLPDGRYWLVSSADFQDRIHETNNSNNWAAVKIKISGTTVSELETKFPS
ncbi:MAG: lysyl oxidase family protein [Actinomycetota bacterium]|nr:lysyl oxidase family protein [Actinomycetota bacterium]